MRGGLIWIRQSKKTLINCLAAALTIMDKEGTIEKEDVFNSLEGGDYNTLFEYLNQVHQRITAE